MKIYVAGKWSESENISSAISTLKKMGHEITFDWTKRKSELSVENSFIGEYEHISNKQIRAAKEMSDSLGRDSLSDLQGVKEAELVIAIMDDSEYAYRGTFTEIGAALALNKHIYILNTNENSSCMTNCFYWTPGIKHFDSWELVKQSVEDLRWWFDKK